MQRNRNNQRQPRQPLRRNVPVPPIVNRFENPQEEPNIQDNQEEDDQEEDGLPVIQEEVPIVPNQEVANVQDNLLDLAAANKRLREQLLERANLAQQKQATEAKLKKALLILQLQTDGINLEVPDIADMQLSLTEENILLNLYEANPSHTESGEQALRLMEGIEKLGKTITPADAERLQSWSDRFSGEKVSLSKMIDKHAVFTIGTKVYSERKKLHISEYEALNWFTMWDHVKLADVVTKLWNKTTNTKHMTLDQAYDEFKIDLKSNSLHITCPEGEQEMLSNLNNLAVKYGTAETNRPSLQQSYFNKLNKKLGKNDTFHLDMQNLFENEREDFPGHTVKNWITCFAHVRTAARDALDKAARYGGKAPELIYSDTKNREKNKKSEKITNNNDSNRQSISKDIFEKRKKRYDETVNCYRCGWWGHKTHECPSKNPDCNEEKIPFHKSVKGKQWMNNVKIGPFAHPKQDLTGEPFGKPSTGPSDNKCEYTHMLLTSITNDDSRVTNNMLLTSIEDDSRVTNSQIDFKNNSDFLNVNISIPTFQMALEPEEEGGGQEKEGSSSGTEA